MLFEYLPRMALHNLVNDVLPSPAEATGEQCAKSASRTVASRRGDLDISAFEIEPLTQLLFRGRCCLRFREARRDNPHFVRIVHPRSVGQRGFPRDCDGAG